MRGKIGEDTKTVVMHRSQQAATTTAIVTYGDNIDTRDYDSALIVLNVGKAWSASTLGAHLYESDVSGQHTMIRVTGGDFPLVSNGSNDSGVMVGNIKCKNYKRYLSLQVSIGGTGSATINYGVNAVLAKGDEDPSGQTLQFDLGD